MRGKKTIGEDEDNLMGLENMDGGDNFVGDRMMMDADDDGVMLEEDAGDGKNKKIARRGRADEQTRRVRFQEMMDD